MSTMFLIKAIHNHYLVVTISLHKSPHKLTVSFVIFSFFTFILSFYSGAKFILSISFT